MVKESVYNFLESKDDSEYILMIAACEKAKAYTELVD